MQNGIGLQSLFKLPKSRPNSGVMNRQDRTLQVNAEARQSRPIGAKRQRQATPTGCYGRPESGQTR